MTKTVNINYFKYQEKDYYITYNIKMGTISGIFLTAIPPINVIILILIFFTFIKYPKTLK